MQDSCNGNGCPDQIMHLNLPKTSMTRTDVGGSLSNSHYASVLANEACVPSDFVARTQIVAMTVRILGPVSAAQIVMHRDTNTADVNKCIISLLTESHVLTILMMIRTSMSDL